MTRSNRMNFRLVQCGIVSEVVFSNMKAHIIYLIMEISQTKVFVQFISGIFSALFYFQLSNHISSGLSRVALVPRYLIIIELKKKAITSLVSRWMFVRYGYFQQRNNLNCTNRIKESHQWRIQTWGGGGRGGIPVSKNFFGNVVRFSEAIKLCTKLRACDACAQNIGNFSICRLKSFVL